MVELVGANGFSAVSLSAAWASEAEGGSLEEGAPSHLPSLLSGQSSLQSLMLSQESDILSLDVGQPSEGSASIELLDDSGQSVAACSTGAICTVSEPRSGIHFLRHHSVSGASALSVTRVPSTLDLQGVWVVTEATVQWSFFRDLFIACVDAFISFMSDPFAAAQAFRIQMTEVLEQWETQLVRENRRLINTITLLMNHLFVNHYKDIYDIRRTLVATPSVMVSEEVPACTAAQGAGGYFEFLHEAGRYQLVHGATGEGFLRNTAGCDWIGLPEHIYTMAGTSQRQVSAAYLERFLEQEGDPVSVRIESADRFSIKLDSGLLPGSLLVLSRLVCAAANLPSSMFDMVTKLEGGLTLRASVPDPAGSRSGVTVSAGFDLGARREQDLQNLGFPADLIALLRPYLGLVRQDAVDALTRTPLTITPQQAELIHERSRLQSLVQLVADYARDSRKVDFCSIPERWQTVISSVQFQYGSARQRTPKFWNAVSQQQWTDAISILRNFEDRYPTRRNEEADYVEALQ